MSSPQDDFPQNPYDAGTAYGDPPPKKRNWLLIILAIIGAMGLIGAVVCCGGGYALFNASMGMVGQVVTDEISDNPVIVEHIGEIQSLDVNLQATSEAQNSDGEGMMAFDIVGDQGSGQLLARIQDTGGGSVLVNDARLIVDGETYELD